MRRLTPKFGRARLNRFAIEPRSRPEPATAFGEHGDERRFAIETGDESRVVRCRHDEVAAHLED